MVEQGLLKFIANGLAGSPPVTPPPGFLTHIEKDQISGSGSTQAYCIKTIGIDPDYVLTGQTGWTEWKVQIDACGATAKDSVDLARAIDNVLRGAFHGVLPDSDSTYVFGIFRIDGGADGYSDVNRTYVRSLEYRIVYQQI